MKLHSAIIMSLALAMACNKGSMNDKTDPVSLSSQDLSVAEGETNKAVFLNLQLSATSTEPVTVNVSTTDGSAKAGEDYLPINNFQVVIQPGAQSYALKVDILGDDVAESDETFTVGFSGISGAILNTTTVTVTIENDDMDTEFTIPGTGYTTPTSYPGMTLIWSDEFDSEMLNENFWSYETGNGQNGWGNNELQYYRRDNTFLREGFLVIEAREENYAGFNYTSSRLITLNKFDFQYGRVDIRAVLPKGQGLWPALWMLGTNIQQVGWPSCGEIDIMEMIGGGPGRDDTVHGTLHWSQNGEHVYTGDGITITGDNFQDAFHVFSIRWDVQQVRWYVDDQLFNSIDITDSAMSEFHEPFFFIFNVAVGGNWPGNPDGSTVFPQRMIVDYVRVFQ